MNPNSIPKPFFPERAAVPPMPYQGITCCGKEQFMDVVEELVRRGIGFKANYDGLTINLTGGH